MKIDELIEEANAKLGADEHVRFYWDCLGPDDYVVGVRRFGDKRTSPDDYCSVLEFLATSMSKELEKEYKCGWVAHVSELFSWAENGDDLTYDWVDDKDIMSEDEFKRVYEGINYTYKEYLASTRTDCVTCQIYRD